MLESGIGDGDSPIDAYKRIDTESQSDISNYINYRIY